MKVLKYTVPISKAVANDKFFAAIKFYFIVGLHPQMFDVDNILVFGELDYPCFFWLYWCFHVVNFKIEI